MRGEQLEELGGEVIERTGEVRVHREVFERTASVIVEQGVVEQRVRAELGREVVRGL